MARYDGTGGNDTYTGTDQADTIMGYAGDDVLSGGKGSDTIDGGEGDDILYGDDGDDKLYGGTGHNTLYGGNGADTFYSVVGGVDDIYGAADGSANYWVADYSFLTTAITFDDATGAVSNGTQLRYINYETIASGYGDDTFHLGRTTFTLDAGGGEDTVFVDYTGRSRTSTSTVFSQFLVSANGLSATLFGDRRFYGASHVTGAEHLSYLGSSQNEHIAVTASAIPEGTTLLVDCAGGRDDLVLDVRKFSGFSLSQGASGEITTSIGRFLGVDSIEIRLGAGNNTISTGDGADVIYTDIRSQLLGSNTILSGGGEDSIGVGGGRAMIGAGAGDDALSIRGDAIFDADGGEGVDRFILTAGAQPIVYHQDTGAFDNGSRLTGFEHLSFVGDGNYFLNSSKTDIFIQDYTPFGDTAKINVTIDLSSEIEGLTFALNGSPTATIGSIRIDDALDRIKLTGTQGDDIVAGGVIGEPVRLDRPRLTGFFGAGGFDTLDAVVEQDAATFVVAADGTVTSNLGAFGEIERFILAITGAGDTVALGAGDDLITATGAGHDLAGGGGDDTINASAARGAVTLDGGDGDDVQTGGDGADLLAGGAGDDKLQGGGGNDRLNGGEGNDLLQGGAGDDTLAGGNGDDILDGQDGIDTVSYGGALAAVYVRLALTGQQDTRGSGLDLLTNVENLNGSAFNDHLNGDDRANVLSGGDGNDALVGGAGDDLLIAGAGRDRLTGGTGADTFVFSDIKDFPGVGKDKIYDFSHSEGDRIDLSGLDADTTVKGNQAFTFIGTDAFSRSGVAELRIEQQNEHRFIVQADTNHDGRVDFSFTVFTQPFDGAPQASDFVL